MFSTIWHGIFFDPIYNTLVFFIDVIPGGDVGLAIVATTVIVKFVLLPLSVKAAKLQKFSREAEPKMKEIKEKYKDNREELARQTMALYKEAGISPFSSILLIFIQLPIVIALYFAVARGGGVMLPEINTALLYSFVPTPETVDMIFLGMTDITMKSLPLAILAGVAQYVHSYLSLPAPAPRSDSGPSFKEDFQRSMHINMRYVLPVVIGVVAYTLSATVALYLAVSGLTAVAQEYFIRKHR